MGRRGFSEDDSDLGAGFEGEVGREGTGVGRGGFLGVVKRAWAGGAMVGDATSVGACEVGDAGHIELGCQMQGGADWGQVVWAGEVPARRNQRGRRLSRRTRSGP